MHPLKTDFKAGKNVSQISASDMTKICNMLNGLQLCINGTSSTPTNCERLGPDESGNGWKFVIPASSSGIDYDKIYVGGIEYTPGAKTSDFLQIGADGSSSWIPAMISPMPTGYEIYNVTKNHIHITGATAGNI